MFLTFLSDIWYISKKKRLDLIEPMLTLAFFLANDVLMLASKASQATVCIVMRLRKQHSLALLCVSKADSQDYLCSTVDLAFMRHLHVLGRLWKRLLNEKSVVGKRRHFSFTSNHERNNKQLRKKESKKVKKNNTVFDVPRELMHSVT